jgi:hypothetical protein
MDRGLADPIETAFDFVEDPFIRGGAPAWVFVPIRMIIGKDGSIRDDPSQHRLDLRSRKFLTGVRLEFVSEVLMNSHLGILGNPFCDVRRLATPCS